MTRINAHRPVLRLSDHLCLALSGITGLAQLIAMVGAAVAATSNLW
jgi:hypothetical protein